jgi:hypothetical protein
MWQTNRPQHPSMVGTRADASFLSRGEYRRIRITLDGYRYSIKAHHYLYYLDTGEWPSSQLDHRDQDGTNNARDPISGERNFRLANSRLNGQNRRLRRNNTSGYIGVSRQGKWRAHAVDSTGKLKHLGYYGTAEAAALAYDTYVKANPHYDPEFRRLNFPGLCE